MQTFKEDNVVYITHRGSRGSDKEISTINSCEL